MAFVFIARLRQPVQQYRGSVPGREAIRSASIGAGRVHIMAGSEVVVNLNNPCRKGTEILRI